MNTQEKKLQAEAIKSSAINFATVCESLGKIYQEIGSGVSNVIKTTVNENGSVIDGICDAVNSIKTDKTKEALNELSEGSDKTMDAYGEAIDGIGESINEIWS
jgi:hypothetical protein